MKQPFKLEGHYHRDFGVCLVSSIQKICSFARDHVSTRLQNIRIKILNVYIRYILKTAQFVQISRFKYPRQKGRKMTKERKWIIQTFQFATKISCLQNSKLKTYYEQSLLYLQWTSIQSFQQNLKDQFRFSVM